MLPHYSVHSLPPLSHVNYRNGNSLLYSHPPYLSISSSIVTSPSEPLLLLRYCVSATNPIANSTSVLFNSPDSNGSTRSKTFLMVSVGREAVATRTLNSAPVDI